MSFGYQDIATSLLAVLPLGFKRIGIFNRCGSNIKDYEELAAERKAGFEASDMNQPGDSKKGVKVILDVVRGEGVATGKSVPSTMLVGSDSFDVVQGELRRVNKFQTDSWVDLKEYGFLGYPLRLIGN
ncbi:hypothetical protein BDZ89DRAFT_1133490 [Hymenopellis radicata]|nr:hypothetical protein BDZ89DRAFT_1133490 [Hymenopellis radicata]